MGLGSELAGQRPGPSHLLLLRFVLVNLVAGALLGAAIVQGWVAQAIAADSTRLTLVIFAVFVVGLALCGIRIAETSRALDEVGRVRAGGPPGEVAVRYLAEIQGQDGESRALAAANLKLKLHTRIAAVGHLANSLVVLGLLGTVIGFIISLSGVKPQIVSDVAAVTPMVTTLVEGMSVALYTTAVGAIGNLWLMLNYRMLVTGSAQLLHGLVALGERHARA